MIVEVKEKVHIGLEAVALMETLTSAGQFVWQVIILNK